MLVLSLGHWRNVLPAPIQAGAEAILSQAVCFHPWFDPLQSGTWDIYWRLSNSHGWSFLMGCCWRWSWRVSFHNADKNWSSISSHLSALLEGLQLLLLSCTSGRTLHPCRLLPLGRSPDTRKWNPSHWSIGDSFHPVDEGIPKGYRLYIPGVRWTQSHWPIRWVCTSCSRDRWDDFFVSHSVVPSGWFFLGFSLPSNILHACPAPGAPSPQGDEHPQGTRTSLTHNLLNLAALSVAALWMLSNGKPSFSNPFSRW